MATTTKTAKVTKEQLEAALERLGEETRILGEVLDGADDAALTEALAALQDPGALLGGIRLLCRAMGSFGSDLAFVSRLAEEDAA